MVRRVISSDLPGDTSSPQQRTNVLERLQFSPHDANAFVLRISNFLQAVLDTVGGTLLLEGTLTNCKKLVCSAVNFLAKKLLVRKVGPARMHNTARLQAPSWGGCSSRWFRFR